MRRVYLSLLFLRYTFFKKMVHKFYKSGSIEPVFFNSLFFEYTIKARLIRIQFCLFRICFVYGIFQLYIV